MANPVDIVTTPGEWTLVAENVTYGLIYPVISEIGYFHTYRLTGEPAPVNQEEGIPINVNMVKIGSTEPIDVYIYTVSEKSNGKVKVCL